MYFAISRLGKIALCMEANKPPSDETRIANPPGHLFWIEDQGRTIWQIKDDDGNIAAAAASFLIFAPAACPESRPLELPEEGGRIYEDGWIVVTVRWEEDQRMHDGADTPYEVVKEIVEAKMAEACAKMRDLIRERYPESASE